MNGMESPSTLPEFQISDINDIKQRLAVLEANNTKFEDMMKELLNIFKLHVEGSVQSV